MDKWLNNQICKREIDRFEARLKRRPAMPFDIRMATIKDTVILEPDIYEHTPSTGLASISLNDSIDNEAIRQGQFMSRAFKSRLNITLKRLYKQGQNKFPTGEAHRAIGRNF